MDDGSNISRHTPLWPGLVAFSHNYMKIHGHLSIIICSFGIIANIINIIVLTRRHMRTPTNCILSALAVADTLTMICYVPFASHFYVTHPADRGISSGRNSKHWIGFLLFHGSFTATAHTVSIWMGVLLAVFRYRHIQSPAKGHLTRMRRLIRARLMVAVVVVFSVIILIPNYMSYQLVLVDRNKSVYSIGDLNIGTNGVSDVMHVNMWVYGIMAKLLPCILMVMYGSRLVTTLKHRQVKLHQFEFRQRRPSNHKTVGSNNRTTRMLIVVLVLFLVTEFPQAVILITSIVIPRVFDDVYMPLGDVMDMTALINNSVNFVLYCAMSTQFRTTFLRLFWGQQRSNSVSLNYYNYHAETSMIITTKNTHLRLSADVSTRQTSYI